MYIVFAALITTRYRRQLMARRHQNMLWWFALGLIWCLSCVLDHFWLQLDQGLPSWDQAEYLSSAIEHGQQLGLLSPGRWEGVKALLDLSPKIPPLSSIISGSLMAVVGQSPDQAAWILSLWHGVLLLTVANWGRCIGGRQLGLLAALFLAMAPGLAEHRVEFYLDLPLTSATTLALFLLYRWQRPGPWGGRWNQAIVAAAAVAASILIKQSALLVVALPTFWAGFQALNERKRSLQIVAGFGLVMVAILPWLQHNWITTLGGTQRAVIISAAEEGDPGLLQLESWIWYPKLLPRQVGELVLGGGLAGWMLHALKRRTPAGNPATEGLAWLAGTAFCVLLATSLSPNKDARYIAPLLPLLSLILARGWLILLALGAQSWQRAIGAILLLLASVISAVDLVRVQWSNIQREPGSPASDVITNLREREGNAPLTVLMTASEPNLNEQTLSYLGNFDGGSIDVRRLGRSKGQSALAREQAHWWILATGNQGTSRRSARRLSQAVRQDHRFERVQIWPWNKGREVELWKRKATAPEPERFDQRFIALARRMEDGPAALEAIFDAIEPWHLLDPAFAYQDRVEGWALAELDSRPKDRDALWSLALINVLRNRPNQAAHWFERIQDADGEESWANTFRLVVLIANWQTCKASWSASDHLNNLQSHQQRQVITALRDLARSGCFDPRGPIGLFTSLKPAVTTIVESIEGKSP